MFSPKVRQFRQMAGALFLFLAVGAGYVSLSAVQESAAHQAKDSKTAEEMATLLKARAALAQKGYDLVAASLGEARRLSGGVNILVTKPEEIYKWSVRWQQAERDLNSKQQDQIAALEAHLKRMNELERKFKTLAPLISRPEEMDVE
jgi:hypothetical protein